MDNALLVAAVLGSVGVVLSVWGGWVLVHEVAGWRWRRSLSAFELRFPRTVSVADVARWVGTVRSMTRARRWWSVVPRWPLCVEITATGDGIQRVILIPARLPGRCPGDAERDTARCPPRRATRLHGAPTAAADRGGGADTKPGRAARH